MPSNKNKNSFLKLIKKQKEKTSHDSNPINLEAIVNSGRNLKRDKDDKKVK